MTLTKTKILLIEENQDMRENTAEILELANYEVLTAENGRIGVSLAKSQEPSPGFNCVRHHDARIGWL